MRPIVIAWMLLVLGCASASGDKDQPTFRLPEPEAQDPTDAMTFRKDIPDRRATQRPWEFYYKHCSGTGSEVYFSKTSYECTMPY